MTILIMVAVVVLVLLTGGLITWLFVGTDNIINNTNADILAEEQAYNPAITLGYEIKYEADYDTQMKEARLAAARQAASTPRGANVDIGHLGASELETASQGLDEDPMTAVRIAHFHGWEGARTGIPSATAPVAAASAAVAAPASGKIELVPGVDYPVIELTDDMAPDEKRKARIANSKARSAAMKAAKEAQQGAAPVAAAAVADAPVAAVAAPVAALVGIEPPDLIEITDDMAADDKRKARIANAKAQSAYKKALKAAGATAVAASVTVETSAPAPDAPPPVVATGIEPPVLIEITDDMPPDEKRAARIANSKAQSAYKKALKAAGVDPQAATVGVAAASAASGATPAAEAPAAAAEVISAEDAGRNLKAYILTLDPEGKAIFQASIESVKGIGKQYGDKLRAIEIDTPMALLLQGATPGGRKAIETQSGISHAHILVWVNMVDLFRIKGVAEEYADLLEKSGVDTVKELAQRNPNNLTQKLDEVNTAQKLVEKLPGLSQVEDWVNQAKQLPRAVFYDSGSAVEAAAPIASATEVPTPAPVVSDAPDLVALGIERPEIIEITDDMAADDIRQARIANAKAKSAFSRALKEAGIDPKTVS